MTSIGSLSSNLPADYDAAAPDRKALKDAAQSFEAVILRQILELSRKAKLADDLFGSNAVNNFRDLQDANLANSIASRGAFGIAALVEKQFSTRGINP